MHSISSRINNVSAFLSTCTMCLLAVITLSSYIFAGAGPMDAKLSILSVKVFPANAQRYSNRAQDLAFVHFNVSADLRPLFNWNTKQLFLYLAAEYTNKQGVKNDVVIWDRIVRRKEDAVINVISRNKYLLREFSTTFKNVEAASYTLKYNVMPYVGVLTYGEAGRSVEAAAFPAPQQHV